MIKCVFCKDESCTCEVATLEGPDSDDHPTNISDVGLNTITLPVKRTTGENSQNMYDWDVCGYAGC